MAYPPQAAKSSDRKDHHAELAEYAEEDKSLKFRVKKIISCQ